MNARADLLELCAAVEQAPVSPQLKAWWRELARKARGDDIMSRIFGF